MVNHKNIKKIGTRAQVMHGNALQTSGGLKKDNLSYNSSGKIISIKASESAKKSNNLIKAGYQPLGKGKFGVINTKNGNILGGGGRKKKKNKFYLRFKVNIFLFSI